MRNNFHKYPVKFFNKILFVFIFFIILIAIPSAYAQTTTVTAPNGGENITAGTAFNITWTGMSNDHHKIGYSTNSSAACTGSSGVSGEAPGWVFICHQSSCSSPKSVTLELNSSTVRVKVSGHNVGHTAISVDCSDAVFTIASLASVPTNLTATTINATAINLSWDPQSSNELVSKYLIFRNDNNVANTTDNNTQNYVDTDLNASTSYNYSVKANNPIGNSDFSNNDTATTTSGELPIVSLNSPVNFFNSSSDSATFNCSATDNLNLANITLYGNWSGGWHANETKNLTGTSNSTAFTKTISPDGSYIWNCQAFDNSSNSAFATSNYTFTIDTTPPNVSLESPANNSVWNESHNVNFSYNVTDDNPISSCSLLINGSTNQTNTTITRNITQNFIIFLSNGTYNWSVSCNDSSGNIGNSSIYDLNVDVPDLPPTVTLDSPVDSFNSTTNSVTFNCSATDDFGLVNVSLYHNITGNFSLKQTSNITGLSNSSNFTVNNIPNGYYIWNCQAFDTIGNASFASSNRTFTVDVTLPPPTDNGNGNGGGGNGGGGIPPTTEITVMQTWSTVDAGESKSMTITNEEIALTNITFSLSQSASNVQITVKKLTDKPADLPETGKKVFQYLNITTLNINSSLLLEVRIKFKVNQSWFLEENIDKNTLALYRYTTAWNKLNTSLISESTEFVNYESTTPGFSVFVIAGEFLVTAPADVCGDGVCSGEESFDTCPEDCPPAAAECDSGEKGCVGDALQTCTDGSWQAEETCQYGCNATTTSCKEAPPSYAPSDQFTLFVVIIVIIIIAGVLGFYFYKVKPKR